MKAIISIFLPALLLLAACNTTPAPKGPSLDATLDKWHQDAAKADFNAYFDAIADDGVFLGTDPAEHWRKSEFAAFSKPYFDKGKAWDFTPYNRTITYQPDSSLAWFDELLKTWMGVCRGSGVAVRDAQGQWKIKQYNLTVTIHNDLIKDFLEVAKKDTVNNGFLKEIKR